MITAFIKEDAEESEDDYMSFDLAEVSEYDLKNMHIVNIYIYLFDIMFIV